MYSRLSWIGSLRQVSPNSKIRKVQAQCYYCNLYSSQAGGKIYSEVYETSNRDPEGFWGPHAGAIEWFRKFDRVLGPAEPPKANWFSGGKLNMCHNAIDRHVRAGKGSKDALIYDSPITNSVAKFTYSELQEKISKLSRVLVNMGVKSGDRVLIYMPMIPEAIVAMLATVRIGAVHSVVFGGFAARELATRIKHAAPKVILSANCGLEPNRTILYKPILDEAIDLASPESDPVKCVIFHRSQFDRASLVKERDVDWDEAIGNVSQGHDCVPVLSNHPLYILYTSGTTGTPKGVVRSTGGHAVVLHWSLSNIFGMSLDSADNKNVWWAASDLGWVVGHSYICYAPLLAGLTTVLYEGKPVGTPDAAQFFRVIHDHGVKGMFTAPTALRAIRRADSGRKLSAQYSTKTLQNLFVAGEHCDMETRIWAEKSFGTPVLDNWWQTETGSPIAATCVGLGNDRKPPPHSCGYPVPGFNLKVIQGDGRLAEPGQLGRIVSKLPMPPGFMDTLYRSDDLFKSAYFEKYPGYYDSMDAGYIDEAGRVFVMARDDDVINVAGHRISTSALEEALLEHEDVTDAAVVGVPDSLKGQIPLALYVTKPGVTKSDEDLLQELISHVRNVIGPVAAFKLAVRVPALPRTRSGKTPRKTISDLAQDKVVQVPPTIEDASVYDTIIEALQAHNFAKNAKLKK